MAEQLGEDLKKALQNILPAADYEAFIKGGATAAPAVENNDGANGSDAEAIEKAFKENLGSLKTLRKAYGMKKGELKKNPELKDIKKAYKAKKSEIKKGFPDQWAKEKAEKETKKAEKKEGKKGEKTEVEKGLNSDLIKSITDTLSTQFEKVIASNDLLVKSQADEIAQLKSAIQTIGKERPGLQGQKTWIEKGSKNEFDESGKNVLSVSANKPQVIAILEEAAEKATNIDIKKAIESEILGFNAGGAPISEGVASYLYKNHGTRLVK